MHRRRRRPAEAEQAVVERSTAGWPPVPDASLPLFSGLRRVSDGVVIKSNLFSSGKLPVAWLQEGL